MLRVSAVIPTFRRPDALAQCLGTLFAQDFPASHLEAVVVNDGSGDSPGNTLSTLGHEAPFPVRYETQAHLGPAAARNRGTRVATGDLLLFLGDDVIADPGLVREHVAAHHALGGPGAVLGREVRPKDNAASPFGVYIAQVQADFLDPLATSEPGSPIPFLFFCTVNLSIGRDLFVKLGQFDESYRHAILEDTELGYRLERAEFPLVYWPAAVVTHHHPIQFRAECMRRVRTGYYMVRFQEKHGWAPRAYAPRRPGKRWLGDLVYPVLTLAAEQADRRAWRLPRALYQRLLEHNEQRGAEIRLAERSGQIGPHLLLA